MYGKIAKAMSMAKLDFSLPRLLGHNSLHKERESGTEGSKFVEKSLSIVDRVISFVFRIEKQGENEALKASWGPLLVGLVVVIAFFGFFGIWAATAPLDGAVIAPGEVVSSLNRQVVQHLEGGIIHQILVQDGDAVSKGQPLVLLNDTAAKANLGIIKRKNAGLTRDRGAAAGNQKPLRKY